MQGMVINMEEAKLVTLAQIKAFLEGTAEVAFRVPKLFAGFPFVILDFHADNGSEYINYQVAEMLKKLLVEFTKSRPRHSNDNALADLS